MALETTLGALDVAVIVAYFATTLSVGLFMGRFVKNAKDFFSGGKKVPWWMGAISSYMAMISSFVFIAHAGELLGRRCLCGGLEVEQGAHARIV